MANLTDTSKNAMAKFAAPAARLRPLVYQVVHAAGEYGKTTDEIAAALDLPRYSVQPRTTELKEDRRIRDSGLRRLNVSGCKAIVWIAVDTVSESVA